MQSIKLLLVAIFVCAGMQAQELVKGQATLIKIKEGVYEIKKEDGTVKKIDVRPNANTHLQGTLSVLFKDCEKTRLSVFELITISEYDLIKTVKEYNNCDYSQYKPTEKEVEQAANFQGDQFKLVGSIGASLNNINFFNLNNNENLIQGYLSFGIAATPGFLRNLQGNLYFTFEANAAFSADKEFKNAPFSTNFKKDTYKISLGAEYHFNKNGTFQPLIGIGVGLANDHYRGQYDIYTIKQNKGSTFWTPKIGALYSLNEKNAIGVIVSYIPKYENDLSFIANKEVIPLFINTSVLNAGLYYYF